MGINHPAYAFSSPAASSQNTTAIVVGIIGNPAPTAMGQTVNVLPQDSPTQPLGPMAFLPAQGATLPAVGDACTVIFDENQTPLCVYFSGVYSVGAAPQTAPASPATGFVIYTDTADGKLKAKAHTGTVTILASP
jgi:hypothetical protein